MLLMTQNMLSCYASYVNYKLLISLIQLKYLEQEILFGTNYWKETIQFNNQQEMLAKFHTWTD